MKKLILSTALLLSAIGTQPLFAKDAAQCQTVKFSDVGWTDITSTTATAKIILDALGYKTDIKVLSVPVTFASLADNNIDVFLGNWMPAQRPQIQPFLDKGTVDRLQLNLDGAKYTLGTNKAGADAGIKDFADIQKFRKELDGKIYGIEPGNDGNQHVQKMIDDNTFGLKDFTLVASSEQGMLSQVQRAKNAGKMIVFLAWAPHPMNNNFNITYLTGGDKIFGPNFGGAQVFTVTRKGYSEACPNVGQLLKNMVFSLPMENTIMGKILDSGEDPAKAAKEWIVAHPEDLDKWLAGVKTFDDSSDGLSAVKSALGI